MSTELAPARQDGEAAAKLQILATEHWSLLATRSMTYGEGLSRVTIFLAILSGAVITLALVAQADHFGTTFIAIAIPLLSVVLYAGVATITRLNALNRDDYRWVIGMNRLRHAYLEMHPELEPNFISSPFDDLHGALRTLGVDVDRAAARPRLGSALHLLQTLPGMLTIIVAAVAALVALTFAIPAPGVAAAGAAGFVLAVLVIGAVGRKSVTTLSPSLEPRFPSPQG